MPRTMDMGATGQNPQRQSPRSLPVTIILSILLVGAIAAAGYFYYQYKNSGSAANAKEIDELTETIGAFMELPEGETPTMATVTDKTKLQDQPFFVRAENGDKVLIYSKNGRAILYRPSTGKIVDVTSVNVNTPVPETAPEAVIPTIVRVAIINSTDVPGNTAAVENQLKQSFPNLVAVSKLTTSEQFGDTFVSDLTGNNAELIANVATALNGKSAPFPPALEKPTDADIVVIIGD